MYFISKSYIVSDVQFIFIKTTTVIKAIVSDWVPLYRSLSVALYNFIYKKAYMYT